MSATTTPPKPTPEQTSLNAPLWEGIRTGELRLQQCQKCQEYQWPPRPWCIHCGGRHLAWKRSTGRGTVYSFTIVRQVVGNSPAFASDIPFVLALIELEEGPRLYAPLIGIPPEQVTVGMRVEAVLDPENGHGGFPRFRPARA